MPIKIKKMNKRVGKSIRFIWPILVIYLFFILVQVPDISAEVNLDLIRGAHRGNSIEFSENTLPAIENALNDPKYNFIEFDIQYTKDGKIIVFHDDSLLRMQDKSEKISELTYQELSEISIYHIPLYDEVMDLIEKKKRVNIEIKSQGNLEDDKKLVDFVIQDAQQRGILDSVLLSSISTDVVKYISLNYPNLKTGKIYLIHPITYLPFDILVKDFYQEMEDIGADYIMLHGINLRSYEHLIKFKPENKTLVLWYFTDEMFIIQKDSTDKSW